MWCSKCGKQVNQESVLENETAWCNCCNGVWEYLTAQRIFFFGTLTAGFMVFYMIIMLRAR